LEGELIMVSALNVLAYSDGRPGHEKQTLAVATALAGLTPLSITTCVLPRTVGWRRLFQGLSAIWAPNFPSVGISRPDLDLIIGAGTTTHLPMIASKWRTRAKLVTCMSPDPLLRFWFDLCLVPRHDKPPARRNIFTTFGPPCMKIDGGQHDPRKGLILAGGIDPKSHQWDTATFMAQIERLSARMPEISWAISSSPRTPQETIAQLRRLAADNHKVTFFSAADTPRGWIETAYKAHDQVWVTADSVSMVYEALTAGCRVGILPVAWKHPNNKFQQGIDDLITHDLVLDFDQWLRGRQWPDMISPLNEAERCALEILKRWWPERLP